MTPSPGLLAHEWAKHGSCMATTPQAYFKVSAILWQSLHWPDADLLSRSRKTLTAGDLRDAVLALNKGWQRDQIGVITGRGGWLREIQMCFDARFRPARCKKSQYGAVDSASLRIWHR